MCWFVAVSDIVVRRVVKSRVYYVVNVTRITMVNKGHITSRRFPYIQTSTILPFHRLPFLVTGGKKHLVVVCFYLFYFFFII